MTMELILEVLRRLGGKGTITQIHDYAKKEGFPSSLKDRTKIHDRLVTLSRKGYIKYEGGYWVMSKKSEAQNKA